MMADNDIYKSAEDAVHEITAGFGHRWPDDYAQQIVAAVLAATGGTLVPAGWQWQMKNPASGKWTAWHQGHYTAGGGVKFREREIFAVVFSDTNPEAHFIEDAENACPHCGGSGHKDDVRSSSAHLTVTVTTQGSLSSKNDDLPQAKPPLHWFRPKEAYHTVVLEKAATRFGTFEAYGGGGCYLDGKRLDKGSDTDRSLVAAKRVAEHHFATLEGLEPEHKENSSFVPVQKTGTVVHENVGLVAYMSETGCFITPKHFNQLTPASKGKYQPVFTLPTLTSSGSLDGEALIPQWAGTIASAGPDSVGAGDHIPRYTTKRLHDEVEKAQEYGRQLGLEQAAAYHDDIAAQYEAFADENPGHPRDVSIREKTKHQRCALEIRALIKKVPS